ncbi:MAG: glycosyl transferase [Paracoccus sp. (in: a-proteobacteria)]|uniref:glycosyl transferase n=1 Tax=Paracoccus sp. TaxID=267 RepID=UPI0040580494|nr:glycosyl transferase [Paracoccus sp. (in: a-proteobacteria)]
MKGSDRPIARKLVRLGFQMLGRDHAHRQDLWPGLAIDRSTGAVRWRGKPLLTLVPGAAILPVGMEAIAIVGSGPSLRDQRIEALGDGRAILCNGAASLAGRIRPLAVAVEDERFVFRHHAMLAALPRDLPLLLSPAALRAWAERGADALSGRQVALIDNLAKPLGGPRRALADPGLRDFVIRDREAAISIDPDRGVVITGTVAFSALQFALAAQPTQILLAGIDLSNDNLPRFYEGSDAAPSGLSAGLARILAGFALAQSVADRRSIHLACASPVSALLGLGYSEDPRLSA